MRRLALLPITLLLTLRVVLGITVRPVYPTWKFPEPDYQIVGTAVLIALGIAVFLAGLFYSIRKHLLGVV